MTEASIITVGDEILIGQIIDTNSAWIGQQLNLLGISVKQILTVGDTVEEIIRALKEATEISSIVLVTGGLGPTKDDLTIESTSKFLNVPLFFHEATYERIKKYFDKLGRKISDSHRDQCYFPVGVELIKNRMGTAPGMLFKHNNSIIISMPGVPYEMKCIMEEGVLPMLKEKYQGGVILHKTLMTSGEGESVLAEMIAPIVDNFPDHIKMAYLPSLGFVRLRITASGTDQSLLESQIEQYTEQLKDLLGDIIFGYDDMPLEECVQKLCLEKSVTVGTAESCTGGSIASKITSVAGSSAYFKGSVIAYSNEIKKQLLNVKPDTLIHYGAVSAETVTEMVEGALNVLDVDVALAISGIAGPDGGKDEKPVGTIWVCVGDKNKKETTLIRAGKDRLKNIEYASNFALNLLRKFLEKR
ncbi:MAG: competence/damage-inducible protein A [Saprospiraceae bacterium]|nr:competence/damage-inducible protein A [Saprospiraceae bacterium]